MRPPRLTHVLVILVGACGGSTPPSSTTPSRSPEVAESEPETAEVVARDVSSFSLEDALVQRLPTVLSTDALHAIPGGGFVALDPSWVAVADRSFTIVRRVDSGFGDFVGLSYVDPAARALIAPNLAIDLGSGETRSRGASSGPEEALRPVRLGCDPEFRRCLGWTPGGTGLGLSVESIGSDAGSVELDITPEQITALAPRPDRGTFDGMSPSGAFFDGDRVVLDLTGRLERLCTIDLRTRSLTACVLVSTVNGSSLDVQNHRLALATDAGFRRVDTRTLETITERRFDSVPSAISEDGKLLLLVRGYAGSSVVETSEFGEVATFPSGRPRIFLGPAEQFLVRDEDALELHRGREVVGTMTTRGRDAPRYDDETPIPVTPSEHVVWGDEGPILVDTWNGIVRFVAGASDVRFEGPVSESEFAFLGSADDRIVFGDSHGLRLGPDGITRRATARPDTDSAIGRAFPDLDDGDGLVASFASDAAGPAFAGLVGRVLRFADREGRPLGAPIRLAAAVHADECEQLEFISAVEVALHGQAPCVPTRIHATTRRAAPLGRAYVDVAWTSDRSRSVVLANRKIELIDGRSGASLLTFDPGVPHPRGVAVSSDGTFAAVIGTDAMAIVDLRTLDVAAPAGARSTDSMRIARIGGDWRVGYVPDANRVFGCFEGSFRSENPFDGTDERRVPAAACKRRADDDTVPMEIAIVRGVVAAMIDHRVSLVRVSDGALLELSIVSRRGGFALAVATGDGSTTRLVGLHPDDTQAFAILDPATRTRVVVPPSGDAADRAIREFFATP